MTSINLDKAIELVVEKLGQQGIPLSKMEAIILEAAWDDLTYSEVSNTHQVNLNTLNGRTAPLLWKKLKPIFGENIGKKNFRRLITLELSASPNKPLTHQKGQPPLVIGASLPNIDGFVGREKEKSYLTALSNKFSFVILVGLEGIGKKTLIAKTISSGDDFSFTRVLWKPLHHKPLPESLEKELLSAVSTSKNDELIEKLQIEPVLIVLESIDALLSPAEGDARALDPRYVSLFRRITEETPSKIIATSTQTIQAIENLVLRGQAMLYNVTGIQLADAESILGSHWNSKAAEDVWKAVGGNPLMLKELSAWSEYANGLTPETDRLSVISALVGNFYEKVLKSMLLYTSDMEILKNIAQDTTLFGEFLARKPKAMPKLKRLIDMGLVQKDYAHSDDTAIHLTLNPLLQRALINQD